MLFNTDEFIFFFLPIALGGYFVLYRYGRATLSIMWLVAVSLFYYGWWNPYYVALVILSIVFNYSIGRGIMATRELKSPTVTKVIIAFGILANLGVLGYYKYANFFIDTLNSLAATDYHIAKIILPIGISFFTFQQIAFLVDAGQGKTDEYDFLRYCLFVLFFPQLVAGPIVHHKEMLPQFARPETFRPTFDNFTVGGTIFIIGLFKKVVIADQWALVATPVFVDAEQGEIIGMARAWEGVFAYSMQLYFDFSGYSDLAIGIARMFGVKLPINFQSPYKAASIVDFWRRWHLTLSRFLRDYVYIPLGGNRKGNTRRHVNLFLTMTIGGMWHGAGWNFLLWGALHGTYLIVNLGWRKVFGLAGTHPVTVTICRLVTFVFVLIAWVPFRAETFDGAMDFYRAMINLPHTWQASLGFVGRELAAIGVPFYGPVFTLEDLKNLSWMVIWLLIVWFMPNTQQLMYKFAPAYAFDQEKQHSDMLPALTRTGTLLWKPSTAWAVFVGLLFAASLVSMTRVSEFLYYQF